ncbi:flagellar hook-basal body complex protein FliE [Clostridium homopropionicum DSM 5847]|uniref:Flagellar hook-basal body complex protein FliE n=1 Tax=Clostridium homopropionicum DSM 5847 TaxID=1121318 RepID=A0A0L6ZDJ0_9CLOT|nr:flagellar hook-basal body complex protein FliE [Clostridium homopropionicum]KOA21017.1 flagellar hook-basal body complex protein FliE [Clostridium homopropionicum DSM 5847]SFF99385.1 flagellar hook-basal body complex protein FliE [Clostridium homopropionicum]
MKINEFIPSNYIYSGLGIVNSKEEAQNQNNSLGFEETLKTKLDEINDKQLEAEMSTESFIKGEDIDIHEVMLKTEEAKLSLELAVQVRNKILEAYQEINRMQV